VNFPKEHEMHNVKAEYFPSAQDEHARDEPETAYTKDEK
jgi:hypothetical protein